jgi:hypothetical protein
MALMVDKGELNRRIWATIRSLYLNRSIETLPMVVWFYLFIAIIHPVLLYSGNRGMQLRKLRWNQWLSQRSLGKKRQRGANLLCLFHPDLSSSPLRLLYSSLSSSSPVHPWLLQIRLFLVSMARFAFLSLALFSVQALIGGALAAVCFAIAVTSAQASIGSLTELFRM